MRCSFHHHDVGFGDSCLWLFGARVWLFWEYSITRRMRNHVQSRPSGSVAVTEAVMTELVGAARLQSQSRIASGGSIVCILNSAMGYSSI